jgi:ubiquinol-cytochrome c reductase cytochrome c1 subunit
LQALQIANEQRRSYRQGLSALALFSITVLLLLQSGYSLAAGGGVKLEDAPIDRGDEKSLQRGARIFVNYCMGCHSVGYQRYSRMAQDIGLSEEDVANNMIFTTDKAGERAKVGSLMTNNMTEDYGKQAFGVLPPNLSLTARSRGADWIYTYLKSYYLDPERGGVGVNNLVFPDTAMPHVLWSLQGWQTLDHAEGEHSAAKLVQSTTGSLSPEEYSNLAADVTNFLAYVSDPIRSTRHRIGIVVMLFLLVLLGVTYLLKKEYWKDVV